MAIEILKSLVLGPNNAHFMIKAQHRFISSRAVVFDAGREDAEMGPPFAPCLQLRERVPGAQAVCLLRLGVRIHTMHIAIEVTAEGSASVA
jgi:hypothetical protein